MIGVIERVKNNVLLKCSTLNDDLIKDTLVNIIDTSIYRFAEDIISLISGVNSSLTEEILRSNVNNLIKNEIIKKIKRKLFIDSLALQITNDTFIEEYVNKKISMNDLKKKYLRELNNNKNTNQLNMTEDLKLNEIIKPLEDYVDNNIINDIKENIFLKDSILNHVNNLKDELEKKLEDMIIDANNKYLEILVNELNLEVKEEQEEGENNMNENINDILNENIEVNNEISSKFDKYDNMTLFNKMLLSLNTKEEKLSRKEAKLEERKKEVEKRLSDTNKNIESNIDRENKLSQRKLDLSAKELELNSKLSEAEVIFLNMKPLIKGLNKIRVAEEKGGSENE